MRLAQIERIGNLTVGAIRVAGGLGVFTVQTAACMVAPPFRLRLLLSEMYNIGVRSLLIICLSGAVVGATLGLQGYTTLARFGATTGLGSVVGLVLIRELGPVLTALLVTGRAGSAIAAGIGAMKATEQLDGLRMMSIDPVHFVVAPKTLAMVLSMPLLCCLFVTFGIFGGYLVGVALLGVDGSSYLSGLEASITFRHDVALTLLKSLVFGVLVGLISTYRGFTAVPNAEGVSSATTSTVVWGSVVVLVFNYFITALWGVV